MRKLSETMRERENYISVVTGSRVLLPVVPFQDIT